jgi:NADH-quinone oxidoreductase subunit F
MATPVIDFYKNLVQVAEKTLSSRDEMNKICIQVGSATCEHAAGSRDVQDEFYKHIQSSGRDDIILRQTGCTGRCSREPIVSVFVPGKMPIKYEHVDRELVHDIFISHVQGGSPLTEYILDASKKPTPSYEFLFCDSSRCGWESGFRLKDIFREKLKEKNIDPDMIKVSTAICFGACNKDEIGKCTHILVRPSKVLYKIKSAEDIDKIIQGHIIEKRLVSELIADKDAVSQDFFDLYGDVAFFNRQCRVALRNCGVVDPDDFDEYVHFNGFKALKMVLDKNDPEEIINVILKSKLRGRGGGGFLTGTKWTFARKKSGISYVTLTREIPVLSWTEVCSNPIPSILWKA